MDPIESWVDGPELRRMADSLVTRVPVVKDAARQNAEGPISELFEGFEAATAPEALRLVPRVTAAGEGKGRGVLAAARELASKGGLLPPSGVDGEEPPARKVSGVAPSAAPPEDVTGASEGVTRVRLLKKLIPFGGWLQEALHSRSYFLLERDGAVLIDDTKANSGELHHLARTLAQAAFTAKRQAGSAAVGNLHIKVEQDSVLEVIPVNTKGGLIVLGILLQEPLVPHLVETAARGLQQVVDEVSG